MSSQLEGRVSDLENALQKCISYLKRMPMNPTTLEQIKAAQEILDDCVDSSPLVGDVHTPSGILIAGAIVQHGKATVFSQAMPGQGENLARSLRHGITFTLHPVGRGRDMPVLPEPEPRTRARQVTGVTQELAAARWRLCESLGLLKHIHVNVIDEALSTDPALR